MERGRARDFGITVGRFPTGQHNAITDVAGVRIGHKTVIREETPGVPGSRAVRTGVTTIWPGETPWRERVYAGTHVLNGYGEMIGIVHIGEWGLLHTPITLTSSLSIGVGYQAAAKWIARQDPEIESDTPMPVVAECDDGFLNDALSFPLAEQDVWDALDAAATGPVAEGCVGAGTGMQCFDFKGGIGTASRVLPAEMGGFTIGALVLTNFGSRPDLLVKGVPVGMEIDDLMPSSHSDGSAIGIIATDAPLLPHQLTRIAQRAGLGLVRCGSIAENWSGEILAAFSTAQTVPLAFPGNVIQMSAIPDGTTLSNTGIFNALFGATVESVEEAVLNAMFMAETTIGRDGNTLHALPIDRTLELLERHGRR